MTEKYVISYSRYINPTLIDAWNVDDEEIAICDTFESAKRYIENHVAKTYNSDIQNRFSWDEKDLYIYSEIYDLGYFNVVERIWYTIRSVDYIEFDEL